MRAVYDIIRAACVIAVMAAAGSLVVEVRFRLVAIDIAARGATAVQPVAMPMPMPAGRPEPGPAAAAEEPGPLVGMGRATLRLGDAFLDILR